MRFSTCTQDDSLGPTVSGCRDDFDFTIKFEMLVLSIVPSSLFILLSIWRTFALVRKPAVVDGAMLQLFKLVRFSPSSPQRSKADNANSERELSWHTLVYTWLFSF